jgi:hypothetical protein
MISYQDSLVLILDILRIDILQLNRNSKTLLGPCESVELAFSWHRYSAIINMPSGELF